MDSSPPTFSASSSSSASALVAEEEDMADDATAWAWLAEAGFAEGDVRSEITIEDKMKCPMAWASQKGELGVCKWLHGNGAADDISKVNNEDTTPIFIACQEGHLSVCKWLFEVGAAADITKAANNGGTPMWIACYQGHLSVCKWLFEVGAAADITRADNAGFTPMSNACEKGHLSVCKWLFEVGAAEDTTKASNNGWTPLKNAFDEDHIPICHWLILNGALSDPYPEADDDHVDQAIVERDVRPADKRPALLAWAQAAVAASASFFSTIVMGAFHPEGTASTTDLLRRTLIAKGNTASSAEAILKCMPDEIQQALLLQILRPVPALTLLRCQAGALELIADFLGVLHERELRNARELADVLVGMGV